MKREALYATELEHVGKSGKALFCRAQNKKTGCCLDVARPATLNPTENLPKLADKVCSKELLSGILCLPSAELRMLQQN